MDMITNVTSLTGNGLKDWLIQRVTAVYFAAYCIFIFYYLIANPNLKYAQWHALFTNNGMRVASGLALLTLSLHAWIGIWTITTDYIKSLIMRLSLQILVALYLGGLLIWGIIIFWES